MGRAKGARGCEAGFGMGNTPWMGGGTKRCGWGTISTTGQMEKSRVC